MCASERGRGVFDIAVFGRCSLLLLDKFLEFDAVVRPDAVGEIVEELEDSERLFGCPFGIDEEVDSTTEAGRLRIWFHAAGTFSPEERLVRFSRCAFDRSAASLKR